MSSLVFPTSRKHTTSFLAKTFGGCFGSVVLTVACYWPFNHCILTKTFMSVSADLDSNRIFPVTASLYCLREFTANNSSDEMESIISEIETVQVHRGLEIKSSRDDIILILIVGYVCYNTITGGISQHSAVALFKLVCCSK